jgi:hypothetical protein
MHSIPVSGRQVAPIPFGHEIPFGTHLIETSLPEMTALQGPNVRRSKKRAFRFDPLEITSKFGRNLAGIGNGGFARKREEMDLFRSRGDRLYNDFCSVV